MYKKSLPKDNQDALNNDVLMECDTVPPVPRVLPEQQPSFSLVATSSTMLPAKAIIFSIAENIADSVRSILLPHQHLAKFLKHVGFGEQDEAEGMLKQQPLLCLRFGDLTDCSQREFKNISAFQYALWALDFHMWQMILKYLPDQEARLQISSLRIRKDEQAYCSWENLINALQTYIDNHNAWSYDQLKNYWINVIGRLQLLLPAHVMSEYHNPLNKFCCFSVDNDEVILPRLSVDLWINASQPELMQLGENFAWVRGDSEAASPQITPSIRVQYIGNIYLYPREEIDKNYLNALFLFRKQQYNMLRVVLMSPHSPYSLHHKFS